MNPFLTSFLICMLLLGSSILAQEIPADLLRKAIDFVTQTQNDPINTLERLQRRDVHTLYQVAKSMNSVDPVTSVQIWHILAEDDHVLSQVALGFAYSEADKPQAIAYFVQAGENGPHQAALYNAGRLLAERPDFPKALAYIRAAANLEQTDPSFASPGLTETCREAYEKLSKQIAMLKALSLQDAADMFLYASLQDFPKPKSKEEKIWGNAMTALQKEDFQSASKQLKRLQGAKELSELQVYLLKALQAHIARSIDSEL